MKGRIAVLLSGRGSNFRALYKATREGRIPGEIVLVITDKKSAPGAASAKEYGIETLYFRRKDFPDRVSFDMAIAKAIEERSIDLICLAGYMRILSPEFIRKFPLKIMNIHPALLPSFPGLHAQKQAVDYGVRFSGATVHFVDEGVDSGPIILQAVVPVFQDDTEETLAQRILREEHRIYPEAVRLFLEGKLEVRGRKVYIKGEEERQGRLSLLYRDFHSKASAALFSSILHKANNKLTSVIARAQLLQLRGNSSGEAILRPAMEASDLLSKTMEFLGFKEGDLAQDVDIAELVSSFFGGTYPPLGFPVDRALFSLVLREIKDNAERMGNVEVSLRKEGQYVVLEVSNRGPLAEGAKERAFEPFFSTWGRAGLGLNLVHGIVTRAYAGEVSLREEGERVYLILRLPVL